MGVYLTTSQIPEMARLSVAQRRFVKERCFFWLFRRFPYRAGSLAITVGSILMASYAAATLKYGVWTSAAMAAITVLVLGYVYDLVWIAHWRPEVARFIKLHADELETTA